MGQQFDSQKEIMLNLREVCQIVGFGKTWVYQAMDNMGFPRQIAFGNSVRWSSIEVQQWLNERKAARHTAA